MIMKDLASLREHVRREVTGQHTPGSHAADHLLELKCVKLGVKNRARDLRVRLHDIDHFRVELGVGWRCVEDYVANTSDAGSVMVMIALCVEHVPALSVEESGAASENVVLLRVLAYLPKVNA